MLRGAAFDEPEVAADNAAARFSAPGLRKDGRVQQRELQRVEHPVAAARIPDGLRGHAPCALLPEFPDYRGQYELGLHGRERIYLRRVHVGHDDLVEDLVEVAEVRGES